MTMASCPHCGQAIKGDLQLAGRVVACPSCQRQFTMPAEPLPLAGPPVVLPPAPQRGGSRRQPPPDYTPRIVAWGITVAIVLVAGIGLIIALAMNSASRGPHAPQASGKDSAGSRQSSPPGSSAGSQSPGDSERLPKLDQLIGRSFSANHPDAEARMAEAKRRKVSVIQSGDKVHIGDVVVSNNPASEYGGFGFGFIHKPDGTLMLTTSSGQEPLRRSGSFASDQAAVREFLKRHHGAASVKIEKLSEQPYYLGHVVDKSGNKLSGVHDGRSREEILKPLDTLSEITDAGPFTITRLERIGTVVRAVWRLQGKPNAFRSDDEFLVLNGRVVQRFRSDRDAILFEE